MMLHLVHLSHPVEQELVHPTSLQVSKSRVQQRNGAGRCLLCQTQLPGPHSTSCPRSHLPHHPPWRCLALPAVLLCPFSQGPAQPLSLPPSLPPLSCLTKAVLVGAGTL